MKELYRAVEGYVKAAFDALAARIGSLEIAVANLPAPKAGPQGARGEAGRDADPAEVARLLEPVVEEKVAQRVALIPPAEKGDPGEPGKDADMSALFEAARETASGVARTVAEQEALAAVAKLPTPRDGLPGKDADMRLLTDVAKTVARQAAAEAVAALPKPADGKPGDKGEPGKDGKDGKDVDEAAIFSRLEKLCEDSIRGLWAAVPKPKDGEPGKDGKSIDERIARDWLQAMVKDTAATIQAPRDGRDGADGKDGKDVDYVAVNGLVQEAVAKAMAAVPKPADGRDAVQIMPIPGIDADRSYPRGTYARHANGLWLATRDTKAMDGWECVVNGVAGIELQQNSERAFSIKIRQTNGAETVQAFIVPTPLDVGIYDAKRKYVKGDGVTYGGSWWIAQVDEPSDIPGISEQWRLAVKRGRDGKDARPEPRPTPGKVKSTA